MKMNRKLLSKNGVPLSPMVAKENGYFDEFLATVRAINPVTTTKSSEEMVHELRQNGTVIPDR
jgi:hypothetical protein